MSAKVIPLPPPKVTMNVDGDILAYRSAAACARKQYTYRHKTNSMVEPFRCRYVKEAKEALGEALKDYERTEVTILEPPEYCLYSLRHTLKCMQEETHAGTIKIYLGGKHNFRDLLDPSYKAGRAPKPAYLALAREYLIEFFDAEVVNGQEVDDKLAQVQGANTVLCSIDKDLLQVPGAHWNWITKEARYITEQEGNEWFWMQMLTGDNVDNIKGIDGVGLITASALVDMWDGDLEGMRGFTQGCYIEKFGNLHRFFLNVQLLYIRRELDHWSTALIMREVS